jgi:membrane AbrB-like protein
VTLPPAAASESAGIDKPKIPPPRPPLRRVALALLIGSGGGLACFLLRMPLAWMMGAALATSAAAFMGAPIRMEPRLRQLMLVVLGVLLGSSFHPGLLSHIGEWSISLALLAALTFCSALAVFSFYRHVGRYDRTTAFFASVPGGLGEMTATGGAMGGDERIIAISHAVRIISVVLTIPVWFRLTGNTSRSAGTGVYLLDLMPLDLLTLAGLGVAGALLGVALRLPAALLVGSMITSAAAHLAGFTESRPSVEMVAAAQVVIGTGIGCRFIGASGTMVMRAMRFALVGGLVSVAFAVAFALFAHMAATDLPFYGLLLAYSPGGVAEMSLIALSLGIDVAMVATHHLFRLFFVLITAPQVFRLWRKMRPT